MLRLVERPDLQASRCSSCGVILLAFNNQSTPGDPDVDYLVWASLQVIHDATLHPQEYYKRQGKHPEETMAMMNVLYQERLGEVITWAHGGMRYVFESWGMTPELVTEGMSKFGFSETNSD
jgi:hypothetical protein